MTFLTLLLLWLAKRYLWVRQLIQHDGWWLDLLRRTEQAERPWRTLCWTVLLPVALTAILLQGLQAMLYGWLLLPVYLVLMVYCLGRGDTPASVQPFRGAWQRGDDEGAFLAAERDLQVSGATEAELFENVQAELLWRRYQGFFAVLFWLMLLGPLLALIYRLTEMSERYAASAPVREHAGLVRHALDWLPVRLLALTFCVVGNFSALHQALLPEVWRWPVSARGLLLRVGQGALEPLHAIRGQVGTLHLDALWQLMVRSELFWLVGFAVWTVVN